MSIPLAVIAAVNDETVLSKNLAASPMVRKGEIPLLTERGHSCAGVAYNAGIARADAEVMVFAHQDVFLPAGWNKKLSHHIEKLTNHDPEWGVIGLYGVKDPGEGAGHVYSTGLRRFVGRPFSDPIQINTLDEMLLIMRRTAGLRFDEKLPGFHLYGTDICMEARMRGMRNYVLPCFALHNSIGIKRLPLSFWRAYLYLRRKWRDRLPITTPCVRISASWAPIIKHILTTWWSSVQGKNNPGWRVDDPKQFYDEHIAAVIGKPPIRNTVSAKITE
jgi:hypothetical protein